jgi:Xaa-Pro aminopeptidase
VANDTSSGDPAGEQLRELRTSMPTLVVRSAAQPIRRLRAIKSPRELDLVRKAEQLTML